MTTDTHPKIRVAVLISGRGSNMLALAQAAQDDAYPAEISLVISNRPHAAGLEKARDMGIKAFAIDHKDYPSRESFEVDLHEALTEARIDIVCCAGFMRVLTPYFTRLWPERLLNIHPSLLPKYKGLHTHERAIEAGDTVHGCTVHFVNEELDGGTIIEQVQIEIQSDDTPDTLAARLIPIEHQLYIDSLKKVAVQRLTNHA